jgi:V/A-type H+-transporting ATPase subunit E
MAEELRELLEKIKREGVDAAEEKARIIEDDARRRADIIIQNAGKEASRIAAEANNRIAAAEDGSRKALTQAARDTLISLRQEIASMLDRIITAHVHKALGAEELARMILTLVKEAGCAGKEKTIISLRKEDLEKLEKTLFGELSSEARKNIVLRHAADIKGGFTISYDSARSCYDFTDRALAEYIAAYLKPKLAKILEEAGG